MEPLIKSPAVGEDLVLWHPEFAAERYRWEANARKLLASKGFADIITPCVFKKQIQVGFIDWFGNPDHRLDHPYRFQTEGYDKEFEDYIPLGNKHFTHIQLYRAKPHSYKDLPIRYFEIAEAYSGSPISNMLAVFLTVFCREADEATECDLMDDALDAIRPFSEHICSHSGEYHRGIKDLVHTGADNSKEPTLIITANERYAGIA